MSMWQIESKGGVVVAIYSNPPMNYFCAEATRELVGLIEQWRSPGRSKIVTPSEKFPHIRSH